MKHLENNIYVFSRNNNNAYLIMGDEPVLIDGVEEEYADEYIKAIESVVPVLDIRHIVINHCEGNRTGTLNTLLEKNPHIVVISSTAGLKFLHRICDREFSEILAKDSMNLRLGEISLSFLLTPYLNWPDSMMTVFNDNLFSCDFMSSIDNDISKYFNENIKTTNEYLQTAIEKVKNLSINKIYPGSGEAHQKSIIDTMPENEKSGTVLVIYTSRYKNTDNMAKTVYKTLTDRGLQVKIINIDNTDLDLVAKETDKSLAIAFGTNTINADAPEKMWQLIAKLDKVNNRRKPCMIFGSYGWSGEGVYYIEKHLRFLKFGVFEKPYLTSFKMNEDEKKELCELTDKFVEHIKSSK